MYIPQEVRPFINKDINDQLYKDLLYDEFDIQRINLNVK